MCPHPGHKSERSGGKSSRGLSYSKTRLSSPDSLGSESGEESVREGGKKRKRDSETQRRFVWIVTTMFVCIGFNNNL